MEGVEVGMAEEVREVGGEDVAIIVDPVAKQVILVMCHFSLNFC